MGRKELLKGLALMQAEEENKLEAPSGVYKRRANWHR